MKISGFTFIRNAIKYDYPIIEAIRSILPICDEIVVAVGNSEDETRDLIQSIGSAKIKIIDTIWDDNMRENGKVLAVETNKALAAISPDSSWCFYIQGDEVLEDHQLDYIHEAMKHFEKDEKVDGFLFEYLHFYGSYDYIGASNSWYKNEIRIIRNGVGIYSYKDAQGFRKDENKKLSVVKLDAKVHHYGWVKDPRSMQQKQENFNKYWHDDQWMTKNIIRTDEFSYEDHMTEIRKFEGNHPEVMSERINRLNWKFNADLSVQKKKWKDKFKDILLKFGIDASYQNYRLYKRFQK